MRASQLSESARAGKRETKQERKELRRVVLYSSCIVLLGSGD